MLVAATFALIAIHQGEIYTLDSRLSESECRQSVNDIGSFSLSTGVVIEADESTRFLCALELR